jgi:hypothetical protein
MMFCIIVCQTVLFCLGKSFINYIIIKNLRGIDFFETKIGAKWQYV